ncbi:cyclic nucleotide-binding domain-containing protein [Georgenia yuyongxinii]|uniref:Cyclic nucleotide-binding domain-containing protein n=1 Tax=Georgenia yuyongxinii TaxID=2589797 RepID=A0A552WSF8_9MICO|nr:cyclic nucleotide-binding domain-containing protein [Georgenia yuyongxinii]TRW45771.1 cyclic nucleotide-binding domain-containing protein [Georgenia yuyongxinii]
MRYESSVLSVSWLPSEAVTGVPRLPFDLHLTHYDDPPPDVVDDPAPLIESNQVRFANHLRAWVEIDDREIVDCGYSGGGHIAVTTAQVTGLRLAFAPIPYPDLQRRPSVHQDTVTFVQTTGGRSGIPAPRHVWGKPFIQIAAPVIWTTLELTIDVQGRARGSVIGASRVPRHWVYDSGGRLASKVGAMDFTRWYHESFGARTPWASADEAVLVTAVESDLERRLSTRIMRGGRPPLMRRLNPGETLVEQGQRGDELFVLLDGVLRVEVSGDVVAQIGPGAVLGERALLEAGRRTSTLRADTPCLVAVTTADGLNAQELTELSRWHHREDATPGPGGF